MKKEMMYSEAARLYNLEPVEVFCPDEKDFAVYVEDGNLYSNADGSRGDCITEGLIQVKEEAKEMTMSEFIECIKMQEIFLR